jgi:hypothetical protein
VRTRIARASGCAMWGARGSRTTYAVYPDPTPSSWDICASITPRLGGTSDDPTASGGACVTPCYRRPTAMSWSADHSASREAPIGADLSDGARATYLGVRARQTPKKPASLPRPRVRR